MAEALDPTLAKKEFHNWLKGAMSVLFAKEGLSEFVQTEITDFHTDLINSVITQNGISPGTTCASCTTANVLSCPTAYFCSKGRRCNKHDKIVPDKKPNIQCPKNLCNGLKDGIRNLHRYIQPSWQNSDATKWSNDAFEVAKCFMPPDGYSGKGSLADTDFNGMIAMIINNKRFQNKMTTQLNTQHNTCSKARDFVNETIRHSGSNELSDLQLAQCIDALRDVLRDSKVLLHDHHAQAAVNKLNQLQNNTLNISAGDITRALEENIRNCLSQQQKEAVKAIKKYLNTAQTASIAALENIKSAALDEIRKTADDKKQELLQLSQQQQTHNDDVLLDDAGNKKSPLWRVLNKITFKEKRLRSNLKDDLITYYRDNESRIPASPLVEDHKVALEDLYVIPPLWAYDNPYYFGPGIETQKQHQKSDGDAPKRQSATIGQLFLSDNQVRFKKIFITANAGFGKTSLSQKITMTWCQSRSPLESLTGKYEDEELDAMKYFDFLFLLHLRDYQTEPLCNLDDLIMQMLSNYLSRNTLYKKEFLQRLLHKKKCLIILDGLDEWGHPDKCRRTPSVPHNNHPDSCTVLTTSRPWKLGTLGLSEHNIDRHIVISELNWRARDKLEENSVRILNERKLNILGKRISDFDEEVETVQIGDIIYIPYILLQLICLFFGGLPIGKSKCEIYINITELTLKRGLNKMDLPDIHVQLNDNSVVPNCMKGNETCIGYFTLLMKLGKLAFYTLFSGKNETSLIFDRKIVTQYMSEQEIEFCLKVGLICQTKDNSTVAEKRFQVFFQHKSVQEFFSAIYITSEWQNESVKSTILKICSSLSSTFEMENLFVFVCGMNPEVYTCISGELQKIVDLDGVTRRCAIRADLNSGYFDDTKSLYSYQSMQMQCLQESMRNGNESCPINLYVITDRYDYRQVGLTFKTILDFNKCQVKSLILLDSDEKTALMLSMDPGVFTFLETLIVEGCCKEPVRLANILTESARTLKCLTLSGLRDISISLSDISITALTGLTCLQLLYLAHVDMAHSNLQCLYAYISQATALTQLKLMFINFQRSQYPDCDAILDLHCLNKLKMLHLDDVPCTELNVNPACLTLSFQSSSLSDINITALTGLTCLQSLYLDAVLMTHRNLKCLYAYISQTTTLTQLKLKFIHCWDHEGQYRDCDVTLDLHRLSKLNMLNLISVPCRELHVNPACLEKLEFRPICGEKMTATASASLWQDLCAAPVLSSLSLSWMTSCQDMIQTIPTLTQLQYLRLERINMGDVVPLSPVMKKLEHLELSYLEMSFAAWRELFLNAGWLQHPITVELSLCRGLSRAEWQRIVNVIKSMPTLSLFKDLCLQQNGDVILTLKNKPLLKQILKDN